MIYRLRALVDFTQSEAMASFIRQRDVVEEGSSRRWAFDVLTITQFVKGITGSGRTLRLVWGQSTTGHAELDCKFPDGSTKLAREVAHRLYNVGVRTVDVGMKSAYWHEWRGTKIDAGVPADRVYSGEVDLHTLIAFMNKK